MIYVIYRYMYWTVWGESPSLERAHLDGHNRKILITNIGRVQDLNIDYVDRRLYWTDVSDQSIRSSDMNGMLMQVYSLASIIDFEFFGFFCIEFYFFLLFDFLGGKNGLKC